MKMKPCKNHQILSHFCPSCNSGVNSDVLPMRCPRCSQKEDNLNYEECRQIKIKIGRKWYRFCLMLVRCRNCHKYFAYRPYVIDPPLCTDEGVDISAQERKYLQWRIMGAVNRKCILHKKTGQRPEIEFPSRTIMNRKKGQRHWNPVKLCYQRRINQKRRRRKKGTKV